MSERMAGEIAAAPGWLALLGERSGGFALDRRFGPQDRRAANIACAQAAQAEAEARARQAVEDAFAAGLAQGRAEAEERIASERARHERLRLGFGQLDENARIALADRLARTVLALCEATLAPFSHDTQALQRRCADAARLLGEAQDRLELHLHPDDIAGLDTDFAAGWRIVARPDFERGTVRIEGSDAGIVDGPAEWRAALAAAFAC
jgi:flagellar biosynthesis/type III secretory pathway protein FliH